MPMNIPNLSKLNQRHTEKVCSWTDLKHRDHRKSTETTEKIFLCGLCDKKDEVGISDYSGSVKRVI